MISVHSCRLTRGIVLMAAVALVGCDTDREPSGPRADPGSRALMAKSLGVTVTATSPSFGEQGQTNERVTITGTGFAPGSQASWLRNGVTDTSITVASTEYVNSTTLVATISISPKSPVDFRDVQVALAGGRTQGIGSLLFEVTQAVGIPGTSWARSINDNGEATGTLASGTGVFYYSKTGGLETVSTTGTGYDISPAGTAIVGSGGTGGSFPYLYTRTGTNGTWQGTPLPLGANSSGIARSMLTDATDQVLTIGGIEYCGSGCSTRAIVWTWQAGSGTWQRTVLPDNNSGSAEVRHRALSASGILGGTIGTGRVLGPGVWMPNGAGGYTLTVLAGLNGAVNGVRADGGMLVGFTSTPSSSTPLYWLAQPGGTWGAPITVAGGCTAVKDVSDAGRFVLNTCPLGAGSKASEAYADPPYSSLTRLGGLGPTYGGMVSAISHSGRYASGKAGGVGVYWMLP